MRAAGSCAALLAALIALVAPTVVYAVSPIKCTLTVNGKVLKYTPKYTASEAAGTPLRISVKTLGKLSYSMHVQPQAGAKRLYVAFVQSQLYTSGNRVLLKAGRAQHGTQVTSVSVSGTPSKWWLSGTSSAGRRRLLGYDAAVTGTSFVMKVSTNRVPKAFKGYTSLVTATFVDSLSNPRSLTCGMQFTYT